METNYVTRDNYGMYVDTADGPGPSLMGADTLLGNDVYNNDGDDLGDIKEFMIDMASTRTIGPRCQTRHGPMACTSSTERSTPPNEPWHHTLKMSATGASGQ